MAGQPLGLRETPRSLNNFNDFQNRLFQQSYLLRNLLGPQGPQVGGVQGSSDPLLTRLEQLLKQFMDGARPERRGAGGEKAAGAAPAGGARDPLGSLEALLDELRSLARKDPEAAERFLARNPELAQMLTTAIAGVGPATA